MCALQNGNHIGDEGAKAIAQTLTHNSALETLCLVRFYCGVCLCSLCVRGNMCAAERQPHRYRWRRGDRTSPHTELDRKEPATCEICFW
jgi:hypothetical protein